MLGAAAGAAARSARGRRQALQAWIAGPRGKDEDGRVRSVNEFFNRRIQFARTTEVWGADRLLGQPAGDCSTRARGDCEDYAIAKYFSLLATGVPVAQAAPGLRAGAARRARRAAASAHGAGLLCDPDARAADPRQPGHRAAPRVATPRPGHRFSASTAKVCGKVSGCSPQATRWHACRAGETCWARRGPKDSNEAGEKHVADSSNLVAAAGQPAAGLRRQRDGLRERRARQPADAAAHEEQRQRHLAGAGAVAAARATAGDEPADDAPSSTPASTSEIRFISAHGRAVVPARRADQKPLHAPAWFVRLVPIGLGARRGAGVRRLARAGHGAGHQPQRLRARRPVARRLERRRRPGCGHGPVGGHGRRLWSAASAGRWTRRWSRPRPWSTGEFVTVPEPRVPELARLTQAMNTMVEPAAPDLRGAGRSRSSRCAGRPTATR